MNKIEFLIPKSGLKIRDPDSKAQLKAEGENKTITSFWRRRISDGDVTIGTMPLAAPVAAANPDAAPAETPAEAQGDSTTTETPAPEPAPDTATGKAAKKATGKTVKV